MPIFCSVLTISEIAQKAPALRNALLIVAFASLSGCAVLSAGEEEGAGAALPAAVQTFLEQAPAGGSAVFPHSPWGAAATVQVQAPYYAASGRTCRELTIESYGVRQPGLACRQAKGRWQQVRVLQHTGRPLLTQQSEQIQRQGAE
jgi:surface antigen